MVRELMPAISALLLVSTPALAAEYEMGNPMGNDGQAELGVVSDLRYEAGVPVGHDGSVSLVVANGVPYDDPAYTFDDTIGSTTARNSDATRDVATEALQRAAR